MRYKLSVVAFLCLSVLSCARPGPPGSASVAGGPPPTLTLDNYEKIRAGMTLPEVEAILGRAGAIISQDKPDPKGATVKEVHSASWTWGSYSATGAEGQTKVVAERRIVIRFQDGKVS